MVLGPGTLQDQFAVSVGEHAHGTCKAHEVDHHLRLRIAVYFQALNLAGWKAKPLIDAEMYGFILGT